MPQSDAGKIVGRTPVAIRTNPKSTAKECPRKKALFILAKPWLKHRLSQTTAIKDECYSYWVHCNF